MPQILRHILGFVEMDYGSQQ